MADDLYTPKLNATLAGMNKARQAMGADMSRVNAATARAEGQPPGQPPIGVQIEQGSLSDGKPMRDPAHSNKHDSPF